MKKKSKMKWRSMKDWEQSSSILKRTGIFVSLNGREYNVK